MFRIAQQPEPPPNAFSLSSPTHMLYKLYWEIAGLKRAIGDTESLDAWRAPSYHAYNCAVTAWHCADWTWEYPDDDGRAALASMFSFSLSGSRQRDAERFFDAVCKRSREVLISRQIANGSKHMKLRNNLDDAVRVRNGWKAGPLATSPSILDGETERQAIDVFSGAASYWEALFRDIGYLEDRLVTGD